MKQAKQSLILCAMALAVITMPARAADIVVGVPNWTSAQVTGFLLKAVLEDNLGLEVETQTGNNAVIFEAMERGSMHVHPEVWLPNQQNLHDEYVKRKGAVAMNPNAVESLQAMCATKWTADTHGIKSIYDLTDPDKAALFDTNGDGLGELWIGPAGWASTEIGQIRAKSYGYAETFELLQIDEALGNAALDAAAKQNKPYVFYCYTPHTMFTLYDLVILDEPDYNKAKWKIVRQKDDPEWLEKSSAEMAFPITYIHIHYAKQLEKTHPDAAALLSNVKLDTDAVGAMMFEVDINKRDPLEVVREWAAKNEARVQSWFGN